MNILFAELLRHGVLIFMDDILMYSATIEEHVVLFRKVFDILHANKFYIKRSKCFFAQPSVEYLGHVISTAGVATDRKVQAVMEWKTPSTVRAAAWVSRTNRLLQQVYSALWHYQQALD